MRIMDISRIIRSACLLALGVWSGALLSAGTPAPQHTAVEPLPVTITFVGDVMLAGGVGKAAKAGGASTLFSGVSAVLTADDLTVANLECAVSTRGSAAEKQYTFRADPKVLPGLCKAGVDAVTLGNNHTLDFGAKSLCDTLMHAKRAGLSTVGAGMDVTDAFRPALFTRKQQRIALLGASRVLPSTAWYAGAHHPGIASAYDSTRLLAAIRTVRARADIVIVYLHWGVEKSTAAGERQRSLAYACIDAGADLVIGSHPHVLQGFEYYRGKFIAYSLGNFVFTKTNQTTAMLQTTFVRGELQTATILPCRIIRYRPHLLRKPTAIRPVLAALQQRSFNVRIDEDGVVTNAR